VRSVDVWWRVAVYRYETHSARITSNDLARAAIAGDLAQLLKDRGIKEDRVTAFTSVQWRHDGRAGRAPLLNDSTHDGAIDRRLITERNNDRLRARIDRTESEAEAIAHSAVRVMVHDHDSRGLGERHGVLGRRRRDYNNRLRHGIDRQRIEYVPNERLPVIRDECFR